MSLLLFASCTAINQTDAFLDALPRPSNVVFSDDFESGLGKWNIGNGSWITSTPGSSGLALKSPTSATPATFTITTLETFDLTGKTGCVLHYEMSYNLSGVSGVSAQIQFAGQTVAALKESTGLYAPNSAAQFVPRKVQLSAPIGKLAVITMLATGTTADLRLDNIRIVCSTPLGPSVTIVSENFESGTANWTLGSMWALSAAGGQSGSAGLRFNCSNCDTATSAAYTPTFSLQNRSGCRISYYFDMMLNQNSLNNSLTLFVNSIAYVSHSLSGAIGYGDYALTAFEGQAGNQINFRGLEGAAISINNSVIDNVRITCQQ